jgi:hypothetical protein
MKPFTRDELRALLGTHQAPCLSIYLPTDRGGAGDRACWRRCLGQAEQALIEHGWRAAQAREFLRDAHALLEGPAFWKAPGDGLAFFLAEGFQRHYRLPLTFTERVVVGRHFTITPLLPLLSGNGKFFVLALSQNAVRLLQATRESASPVALPGVPKDLEEALARHDVDEPLTFHSHPAAGLGRKGAIFHGHGVGIDDHKDDLLRYFQAINRGLAPLLRGERGPLVLMAVDYLQPIFRRACGYPGLLPEGLEGNPDRLSDHELHELAWPLVEPLFRRDQDRALALFRQLHGTGLAAVAVEEVASAACRGGVETLFVAHARTLLGWLDEATGAVEVHEPAWPGDEDLVNRAALDTLRHGGTVYEVPAGDLPDGSPLAALFWLPLGRHAAMT